MSDKSSFFAELKRRNVYTHELNAESQPVHARRPG
jgi:hypothetical protein